MRNRLLKSFAALAVCTMLATLASPAFGQRQDRSRNSDRYDRGDRGNIGQLIQRAESETNQFVAVLGQVSDRRDGFLRGGRLTQQARDLERQLNVVRQEFERGGNNNYRIRTQVSRALSTARSINSSMRFRRLNVDVEREWSQVRGDLNRLARAYNLSQIG